MEDKKSDVRGKGTHKAELMRLVEAAYNEGSFSKQEIERADPKTRDNVSREVAFTFTLSEQRLRDMYEIAKRLGV
jgi:hypothetical protein